MTAGSELEPEHWTPDRKALWHRIEAHSFEPDTRLPFTARLARDHSWHLDEARAAVDAYRRFCFLACVSSTPVTPSEAVDEVWHLHLTYSRDYWDVWCGQVLRTPLHHDPTPGGPEAQMRYRLQYAQTLALHERFFGAPDEHLWPGTVERFGPTPRYTVADRERVFLVPRPRVWLRLFRRGWPCRLIRWTGSRARFSRCT
jgi:hypothetical protein